MSSIEPNIRDKIMTLCSNGDLKGLTELLRGAAAVDLDFTVDNHSPLTRSITEVLNPAESQGKRQERIKIIQFLLGKGADPNFAPTGQPLPIFLALSELSISKSIQTIASIDMLEILLAGGADPNRRDVAGKLPLNMGLLDADATSLLLQKGASLDMVDETGIGTSLFTCVASRKPKMLASDPRCKELPKEKLIKYLKEGKEHFGKNLYEVNHLLTEAIGSGNVVLVDAMLETYGDILTLNEFFLTSNPHTGKTDAPISFIFLAKRTGNADIVRLLMDKGSIDYETYSGSDKEIIKKRDFLISAYTAIEAGHLQGFGVVKLPPLTGSEDVKLVTEGFFSEFSVPFLVELLDRYLEAPERDKEIHGYLTMIREGFHKEAERFGDHSPEAIEKIIENYEVGGLEIISTGWFEHAFTVAIKDGYLFLSNRGDKASQFGFIQANVMVFKLKDNAPFREVLPILRDRSFYTPNNVMSALGNLVDLKQPLASFPSKDQKRGTCAFVNAKSIIEAILYFLKLQKQIAEPGLERKMAGDVEPSAIKEHAQKYARKQYKLLTHGIRALDLEGRIKRLRDNMDATGNKMIVETEYQILKEIIVNHYGKIKGNLFGQEPKRKQEMGRVAFILQSLPVELSKKIIAELSQIEQEFPLGGEQSLMENIFLNALILKQGDLVRFLGGQQINIIDIIVNALLNREGRETLEFIIKPLLEFCATHVDIALKEQLKAPMKPLFFLKAAIQAGNLEIFQKIMVNFNWEAPTIQTMILRNPRFFSPILLEVTENLKDKSEEQLLSAFKVMVNNGACLAASNAQGETIFDIAKRNNNQTILKFLAGDPSRLEFNKFLECVRSGSAEDLHPFLKQENLQRWLNNSDNMTAIFTLANAVNKRHKGKVISLLLEHTGDLSAQKDRWFNMADAAFKAGIGGTEVLSALLMNRQIKEMLTESTFGLVEMVTNLLKKDPTIYTPILIKAGITPKFLEARWQPELAKELSAHVAALPDLLPGASTRAAADAPLTPGYSARTGAATGASAPLESAAGLIKPEWESINKPPKP